ncbi:MAG: hypothetical protein QME68_05275, partial [Elusimicrobiota bacterium]|nr:hypothetical protein [Elusimicrobiota bacterium]
LLVSVTCQYESGIPDLLNPINNFATNYTTINFAWADISDTVKYRLEISTSIDFTPVKYSSEPTISNATIYNIAEGRYYWRVRSYDYLGNYSAWASTRSVNIQPVPVLVPVPDDKISLFIPPLPVGVAPPTVTSIPATDSIVLEPTRILAANLSVKPISSNIYKIDASTQITSALLTLYADVDVNKCVTGTKIHGKYLKIFILNQTTTPAQWELVKNQQEQEFQQGRVKVTATITQFS